MPKRSSASSVISEVAARVTTTVTSVAITGETAPQKNQAAVSLGRLGGLKGGPARAAKLSPNKRKAIAKKAAKARWSKGSPPNSKS